MGKPAARIGDMTAHGGSIIVGNPMVLIGGMPAARLGDMHVCPMLTPGVPPIPHVGGPVTLGSTGVLIGGQPAARMGDMATCVGPPDSIVLGCPTVLIGEMASGAASAGGAGGGGAPAVTAAQTSAATAVTGSPEATTQEEHWIEMQFTDTAGNPVSGIPYKFTDPDGNEFGGILRMDGTIRRDALSEGQGEVVLMSVSNAQWEKESAEVGEKVKMSVEVEGFEKGTQVLFQIFKRDLKGPDTFFESVEAEVQNGKVEAEWEYVYPERENETEIVDAWNQYSAPQYYFDVGVKHIISRSNILVYKDYIEMELNDESDNSVADTDYVLYVSNGEVRKGKLDSQGYVKEEGLPPVTCRVIFPDISESQVD